MKSKYDTRNIVRKSVRRSKTRTASRNSHKKPRRARKKRRIKLAEKTSDVTAHGAGTNGNGHAANKESPGANDKGHTRAENLPGAKAVEDVRGPKAESGAKASEDSGGIKGAEGNSQSKAQAKSRNSIYYRLSDLLGWLTADSHWKRGLTIDKLRATVNSCRTELDALEREVLNSVFPYKEFFEDFTRAKTLLRDILHEIESQANSSWMKFAALARPFSLKVLKLVTKVCAAAAQLVGGWFAFVAAVVEWAIERAIEALERFRHDSATRFASISVGCPV